MLERMFSGMNLMLILAVGRRLLLHSSLKAEGAWRAAHQRRDWSAEERQVTDGWGIQTWWGDVCSSSSPKQSEDVLLVLSLVQTSLVAEQWSDILSGQSSRGDWKCVPIGIREVWLGRDRKDVNLKWGQHGTEEWAHVPVSLTRAENGNKYIQKYFISSGLGGGGVGGKAS